MTDLTGLLQSAVGDGVHWTLEMPSDLNVNLVHLDAIHVVGEHANNEVDVIIVVLGWPRTAHDRRPRHRPRSARRRQRAADVASQRACRRR